MKKKWGLLSLSAVMTLSLAACGGAKNSAEQPKETDKPAASAAAEELKPEPGAKLVLWRPKGDFVEYAMKEFEKKYNIPVTLQEVSYDDMVTRYKTDGPAGTGGDVISFGQDRVGEAVKAGIILPNDYFEEETKKRSTEQAINAVTWDGVLYGYPNYVYTYALYVNKDLVKDAKLDTWDDIKAFAKQFNDIPNNKYGFVTELNSMFFDYSFMSGYGAYVFGKNGTDTSDIGLNNEGAVKGMEFFKTLKEILPINVTDITSDVKRGLWEQGKAAINLDGAWNMASFGKLPFPVKVVPLPKMPGGKDPIAFAGVSGFYVTSYSKYPNAAKLFANFLASEEMQMKEHELTGYIPVAKNLQNESMYKDEITQGFLKQVKNTQLMPNIPEMQYFWPTMTPAMEQIWKGADIKTTLDKAVQNFKDSIAAGKK